MSCSSTIFSFREALALRRSPPDAIAGRQLARLKDHLRHAAGFPFYRRLFAEAGFNPGEITSVSDLAALPLLSRRDLAAATGMLTADPPLAVADIALTSGTTDRPLVVPYTAQDLERLAFNEQISLHSAGLTKHDRVLLTVTLDRCFVAGFAYFRGLVRLGATTIRSGPGQPARQWQLIEQLQPTALLGVPSFLLSLARWGNGHGYAPRDAGIKTIIAIGEPIRKADFSLTPLGRLVTDSWGAEVFSSYGVTELETAFGDCREGRGAHIHPEMMVVEIVDDQGLPVADGFAGEVVATPLGVRGFPLVRFRTGDIARVHTAPCPCGWTTPQLGPIEGRLSQRLKYKGTTLYPTTILHALYEIPGVDEAYIEVEESFDLSDEVTVVVGTDGDGTGPDEHVIEQTLQAHLRVTPRVRLMDRSKVRARMYNDQDRKPKTFFDLRKDNPTDSRA
jgi:phenylacetate-CoA ligase